MKNIILTSLILFTSGLVHSQNKFYLDKDNPSQLYSPFSDLQNWNTTAGNGTGQNTHKGDDYYAIDYNKGNGNSDCDNQVYSVLEGEVIFIGDANNGYGNQVIVRSSYNRDFAVRYAHLQNIDVSNGQCLEEEDFIGTVGTTGNSDYCHLHLVLYKNLKLANYTRLEVGNSPNSLAGGPSTFAASFDNNAIRNQSIKVNFYRQLNAGLFTSPSSLRIHFELPDDHEIGNVINVSNVNIGDGKYTRSFSSVYLENGLYYFEITDLTGSFLAFNAYDIEFDVVGSTNNLNACLVDGIFVTGEASFFNDVDNLNIESYNYLNVGLMKGLFKGIGSSFKPADHLTRGQAAKVIADLGVKLELLSLDISTSSGTYTDVDKCHDFFPQIQSLKNSNIISNANYFLVDQAITYGQFCKILYKALFFGSSYSNVSELKYFEPYQSNIVCESDPTLEVYISYIEEYLSIINLNPSKWSVVEPLGTNANFNYLNYNNGIFIVNGDEFVNRKDMAILLSRAYQTLNPLSNNFKNESAVSRNSNNVTNVSIIGSKLNIPADAGGSPPSTSSITTSITINDDETKLFDFGTNVDNNGNPLAFFWSSNGGTIQSQHATHRSVKFTPPDVNQVTEFQLYVWVGNTNGKSADAYVTISVQPAAGSNNCNNNGICEQNLGEDVSNCDDCEFTVDFSWDPEIIIAGQPVDFEETTSTGSVSITNWAFQGGNPSEITDNSNASNIIFSNPGNYIVTCDAWLGTIDQWASKTKLITVVDNNDYLPDLTFSNATTSQSTLTENQDFVVNWTVFNEGIESIYFNWIEYYWSSDENIDASDYQFSYTDAQDLYTEKLNGGGSFSNSRALSVPNNTNSGNYFLIVKLIPWNNSNNGQDSDQSNNTFAIPITVETALPDLTIQNINVPSGSIQSGQDFTVNMELLNIGNALVPGSPCVDINVYLSQDAVLSEDDGNYFLGMELNQAYFCVSDHLFDNYTGPPYFYERTISSDPFLKDGNYFLIFALDVTLGQSPDVIESNENNNVFAVPITVSNPNQPSLQAYDVETEAITETSLRLKWKNGNGSYRMVIGNNNSRRHVYPSDGYFYNSPNSHWQSAESWYDVEEELSDENIKILYVGTGNNVDISGLNQDETYFFSVYEFNGVGVNADYLQANVEKVFSHTNSVTSSDIEYLFKYNNNGYDFTAFNTIPVNDTVLLAVGEGISVSSNSGESFLYNRFDYANFSDIQYMAENNYIAVGDSDYIFKSSDGNKTWQKVDPDPLTEFRNIYAIYKHNNGDLFLLARRNADGVGIIYRSTDNGGTWDNEFTCPANVRVYDISGISNEIWVSGRNGTIFKSNNDGDSWFSLPNNLPTNVYFGSISMADSQIGYCKSSFAIYKTENGGTLWDTVALFTSSPIDQGIHFNSSTEGFTSNNSQVLETNDGGETWISTDFSPFGNYIYNVEEYNNIRYIAGQSIFQKNPPTEGCTTTVSHNYNSEAQIDDGTCETCSDEIQNGDETGIDCGGILCEECIDCKIVTNVENSGIGSLRYALNCAGPNETITFAETLVSDTIRIYDSELFLNKKIFFDVSNLNNLVLLNMSNDNLLSLSNTGELYLNNVELCSNIYDQNAIIKNKGILRIGENVIIRPMEIFSSNTSYLSNEGQIEIIGSLTIKE